MTGARRLSRVALLSATVLIVATIPAEARSHRSGPAVGAASMDGTLTAYAGNTRREWIVPITVATRIGRAHIPISGGGDAIAITPDAATAFVTGEQNGVWGVIPITVATGQPGPVIPVDGGDMAISPDGSTCYVTTSSGVVPIDVKTRKVGRVIAVPGGADAIAITPDGTRAFVTTSVGQQGHGWVTPIRLADRAVGRHIRVPAVPAAIAITPNGRTLYVTGDYDGVVTPVDVSTRTPGKPIPVEIYADTVAIAPDGRRVYVGTIAAVDIVDVATNAVIGSVNGGWVDFPNAGLAITPDGATLFVSDDESTGGSFAQAITLRTNEPGKIFSHAGPGAIAVTPAQAPTARFTWTAGPVGAATHFDASRSIPGTGHIARYAWHFGDGTGAVTTTPRTSHVYSVAGTYTTVLQVTNSQQTSVRQVFTGQTMSRNGAPRARRAEPVTIR